MPPKQDRTRCKAKWIAIALILIAIISVIVFNSRRDKSERARRAVPYATRAPIMTTLIRIISEAATLSQTKPFLLYGTLLGYVRNQDFICYDFDVDIGIKGAEYKTLYEAVSVVVKSYPDYKIKVKAFMGWRQFEVVHIETEINADVFEFIKERHTYRRNVPSWYSRYFLHESRISYPIDWIDELRTVEFKGYSIFIPNKPDQLLMTYYGNNYITPDHICNAACGECVKV